MNENVIKDIMVQEYRLDNYFDPTKIFIFMALVGSDNKLSTNYSIVDITRSVYRLFISNLNIAKSNLNITIRNLEKYGVADIVPHVTATIKQIIREEINNSFRLIGDCLYVNFEDCSETSSNMIMLVCKTLFKKYYKTDLKPIMNYKECAYLNDKNIHEFGKCSLMSLIFEDLQYCPLCEETQKEKLFVTHILLNEESDNTDDAINKNNLLLLCEDEWKDYVNKLFYFDEFGRVINLGSPHVNNKMRLSQLLLNEERKDFLKKHYQLQKK